MTAGNVVDLGGLRRLRCGAELLGFDAVATLNEEARGGGRAVGIATLTLWACSLPCLGFR
ncbi:hypothetical protein E5345_05520 [Propionibacterium sp. NM47_B9-13]|uniref:Uncharacterized protein n=1 Tax=Cutibacterium modestum TaxID=2559073 RepID=A0AAD1KPD2_9ACTN|nr:hypothetical protein BCB70_01395 [Cutibacterium modestum]EFS74941.1 hypothetical protein HMPREF9621_00572 [Cutibacterium modestum HL037PA2]EFT16096.1 hypothetical protein HMPREF9622_00957 [Cutibacterium modestum HL037PA3]EGG26990.1 hypothetical protein PA08_1228 [Cutibacterium modestum P08]TGY29457.1 hypothetical protein E5345_05520 [Propionibacterium sp. NM47_B9-13]